MKEQQTSPIVEDGKILKHTDNNGEVLEYCPAAFKTLYVDLRSIALGSSVVSHREPEERLQLRQLVTGIGRIQDKGFSVIGDPSNKTTELEVTINCRSVVLPPRQTQRGVKAIIPRPSQRWITAPPRPLPRREPPRL